ncbi:MAG: DUF2804 domain-containing protein [Bacilli bacterium]|nr:DUF2804 domain-containing protein [Bacilli bacterium]
MRENHLLSIGPLLDENGNLCEAGYATSLVKQYDRNAIKAGKSRIKEWDYYYVGNSDYGIALTMADNGYMSMFSVSVLDFKAKKETTTSKMGFLPLGKLNMPATSAIGDVHAKGKGYEFSFLHVEGMRRLVVRMDKFEGKDSFLCDIFLEETSSKSLVIATPFRKRAHFYYNQKINCLKSHGYAEVGSRHYDFNSLSYGVLDWGRGVWTYKNTWYWCSASAFNNGHLIGWNLGYGFGDTSAASENMLFVDGEAYKLGNIRMVIPLNEKNKDDYLKPWRIVGEDPGLNLTFTPIIDRHADTNVLLIRSNQHQVFGTFSGTISVDGKEIEVKDLPGFAEKVYNKW